MPKGKSKQPKTTKKKKLKPVKAVLVTQTAPQDDYSGCKMKVNPKKKPR